MTTAVEIIASVVGILGGLSLAFGGWSSLSLGARSLFVTTQFISGFAMGFVAAFTAIISLASSTNEWIALGAAGGAGVLFGAIIGFVTSVGPSLLLLVTGAIIGPYLLLIDAHDGVGLFPADNQLARQEFVVAFLIIFILVCSSRSKTNEMENHRFKYVIFTAVVGGWLLADGVSRFVGDDTLSMVLYDSFQSGGNAALKNIDASAQVLMFLVWGGVALVGVLNQMAMRWGLICYNRVGSHAQLGGGPIEEDLPALPSGAMLAAQTSTERVRMVCENCFATVPSGTAFCTECGEAMPTDDMDPNVSISQAQMPSVAMNSTTNAPERWQPVPHRAYVSTTSFVDPKMAKEADMKGDGRSIRFMDAGVQDPDGKLRGYNDNSMARPNFYEPSFRSFAMSTYSIANRAAEPVETPNIRKYKMSGSGIFHLVYFLSGIIGIWWLVFLVGFYPQEYYCSKVAPTLPCSLLEESIKTGCYSSTKNFDTSSSEGYCIRDVPGAVWLMYSMMVFSEFLNFFLGLLFNFSMWRPIRRGARYMNDFKPPIPKEQWPSVDVFLCHYTEPVSDTMQTLKNCLAMQYPPELLHIFILDDGYTKSVWDANNHFKVSVNTKVIEQCGDLRGDLARLMHERIVGPVQDDTSLKSWRRQHSSVRELRKEGGKGVQRRDCAVGSLSDDYDYRDRGIPRVTFIGRMKPETHHSKAGNINNALFNEGADGKYLLILDNDMKPHPKFLLAVLPFFFSEGEAVDGGGRQYSDDISWNQVSYVQTPQYFEDTPQLTLMGDPCGHKNTIFFDAVQCGRDGFDSAAFAGTNAVFRRQAFDSIGGIQYGTQTEDAYTGNVLHTSGWDSVYFRKDFEGEQKDRIRLCEGAIPETVAASMGQKKRWAKGAVQILLMKQESEVDPDWRPPRVPAPDPKPSLAFPRKMFFWDSVFYPFGSIPALFYVIIAIYYLNTGDAPIYAKGTKFLYSFLPLMLIRWMLNLLANRAVDNNDVWRAQQTWFSYSFITALAIFEALQARITGKDKSWANTGAGQKTSWTEIPNVLIYFTILVSQVVALIRFFQYENATNPWNYVSAMFFGFFIMSNFYPMVKMSITEYCGWDHTAATFTANVFGSLIMVFVVVFVQLWQVYFEGNLAVARGETDSASTTTFRLQRAVLMKGSSFSAAGARQAELFGSRACYTMLLLLGALFAAVGSRKICTFEGYYDAGAATSEPCPGALPCDSGFFCTGGVRRPCPAGTYGVEPALRSSACSAICPGGFFCPAGSISPVECGGADVYCPLRSVAAVRVPEGFFSMGAAALRRDRIAPCPKGFFCLKGTKRPCPAGTYGASLQLKTPMCTDACPAGSYCPEQSVDPILCPGGTFGDRVGLKASTCVGQCREGFFCPPGSISANEQPCGTGTFCPPGSERPSHADAGAYVINGDSRKAHKQIQCPKGSFCRGDDGFAVLCPGGTYGDAEGLKHPQCAGACAEGFYCLRGSTSATQNQCGGSHVYCPRGSSKPQPVTTGFYSVGSLSIPSHAQKPEDALTRSTQRRCEPGHYCINGERFPCPASTFGDTFELTSSRCAGKCRPGFYCPERSIVGSAVPCGSSDLYCPEGSAEPTKADQGYCTTSGTEDNADNAMTRSAQRQAEPGEFAWRGACFPCPAGTFGVLSGEVSPRCAGTCSRGYYCPPGSTSPTQNECGGADKYCPEGLGGPLEVHIGHYTSTDGTVVDTMTNSNINNNQCPPGMYRSTTVNNYMDLLTGRRPVSVNYGDARFQLAPCVSCPLGTFKPGPGDDLALCVLCPMFTTTNSADRRSCECFRLAGGLPYDTRTLKLRFDYVSLTCAQVPVDSVQPVAIEASNSIFTRSQQFPCERGYYCSSGVRYPCPGGRFGSSVMETIADCTGSCAPGFYCPLSSTNSTARLCGDANVYCPVGSAVPTPVVPGYYSIRMSPLAPKAQLVVLIMAAELTKAPLSAEVIAYTALNTTANEAIRDAQAQCEAGFYCVNGQKFVCPAGRYGDQRGETSLLCAGTCQRGYFCPPGSVTPTQQECGSSNVMCRTGSPLPAIVPPGFYSVGGTNTTRFYQRPCEPGFFCTLGVKYQCPEGSFGATSGLQDVKCSGPCSPGYYCPSYPNPPSVSATHSECGNAIVYCPLGTGNTPAMVQSGFYTVGAGDGTGDARNATRTAQHICPQGFYCRRGIVIRCPEGTYGDEQGLSDDFCKGWCPPGFACPRGTADYRANKCPRRTYAPKGSAYCIECPPVTSIHLSKVLSLFNIVSEDEEQTPCTNKRECCFFG